MKIEQYTHQGKRPNQEDYMGHTSQCFIVCDGIGGHAKGEIASQFVVNKMLEYLPDSLEINQTRLDEILITVQKELNGMLETMPEARGMGTTFCGLFLTEKGVFVVHIGDSRLYWVRPSAQTIWHTWDHSFVADLLRKNEISREEARLHPMGNRINRAIIANLEGLAEHADIQEMDSLEANDLFLICSDGVTECWPEYELMRLLCDESLSVSEKLELIQNRCSVESKDNNTAFLIEIKTSDLMDLPTKENTHWIKLKEFEKDFAQYTANKTANNSDFSYPITDVSTVSSNKKTKSKNYRKLIRSYIFAAIVFALLAVWIPSFLTKKTDKKPEITPSNNIEQTKRTTNKIRKNTNEDLGPTKPSIDTLSTPNEAVTIPTPPPSPESNETPTGVITEEVTETAPVIAPEPAAVEEPSSEESEKDPQKEEKSNPPK